jgi:hypothetical protein
MVGCSWGQDILRRKNGLGVVVWAMIEVRSMLVNPIDLRRTMEGELEARTHGNHSEPDWGRSPQSSERGRREEKREMVRSAPR